MKKHFLIFIVVILSMVLSACAAARTPSAVQDNGAPAMEQSKGGRDATGGLIAPAAPEAAAEPGFSYSGQVDTANMPAEVERMVIRNADMAIIVDDPTAVMNAIADLANRLQGYVVTSNLYQTQNSQGTKIPEGSITIRVPAEKLEEAKDSIVGLTKNPKEDVLRDNTSGQDVTKEYTDLSSRLKNLQDAEEQLRTIMAEAKRTEDVLNVFNQLTSIREQIEVIKGQMQYYEQASALSAISVSIQARASIAPITVAGWTPVGTARDAIQALVEAGQFIASAAIWLVLFLLPSLLLIGIPVVLIFLLVRRFVRRGRKPSAPVPAE